MAFTGNYVCDTFKTEILTGVHDFTETTGHTFKIALYTSSATMTEATAAYSAANEIVFTGYTAGGAALSSNGVASGAVAGVIGKTAFVDFDNATWSGDFTGVRGALIYNSSVGGNPAVAVLDFGMDKASVASTFTVEFPTADAASAIVRIA